MPEQIGAPVGERGLRDRRALVPQHDRLGARAIGGGEVLEVLEDRHPLGQADLGADRVEVQHRLGQRAVEVEDHRPRYHHPSLAASGAPPVRATSSFLILLTSIPLTRLVIDGKSSSIGGGSPLMNRSGFERATTKLRR